ncbi:MAG: linear amide C-N hydrolase [Anaeroplasmataceae bacterium]|nr:linear amide C-N hydrolase [Anaeroplasmataceae bacterium]MDE6414464.1 linear amide C-N hydrolase [Anaeroplasmataceae bacterium]
MKKKIIKRVLLIVLCVILGITLVGTITVYSVWHNEIDTAFSFKKLRNRNEEHKDGALYEMTVSGDYYFEEFREKGASSDSELISYITSHITKGLIPMKISESEIGCSAFTAELENGDRVFGRNYDFARTNTCIVKTKPSHGYKSVSTIDLQFLGLATDKDVTGLMNTITALAAPFVPLDGINEKGVSCAIFMSYQGGNETVATNQKTDKPDITSTTMLRLILDYAATVEEAVALVEKYDLHDSAQTSYHYMVADANGRSAILEWVNGTDKTDNDGTKRKLVVTYNDQDSHIGQREADADYQWITNFIIQPDYYESDEEKAGFDRYNIIYNGLYPTNGKLKDEQAAMDILESVGQRYYKPGHDGCTVHSVVYNLTKGTSYFIPNENYKDDTAKFHYSL